MRISLGVRGGCVFKKLYVGWGGEGRTAEPDRGARLRVEERLRDGAGDVQRDALAERIDQAYLILDGASMALRGRPASRQQKPDDYQQTFHVPPLYLARQATRGTRRQS